MAATPQKQQIQQRYFKCRRCDYRTPSRRQATEHYLASDSMRPHVLEPEAPRAVLPDLPPHATSVVDELVMLDALLEQISNQCRRVQDVALLAAKDKRTLGVEEMALAVAAAAKDERRRVVMKLEDLRGMGVLS